ncbi:hypothetical protein GCM10023340_08180 [Nocardioides marinquilinus]|uniref:eCIS core domain-containing protein n=1 Tax=Nocardioides marinquilinus TaxID=1210400 RepID=A0ABP9PDL4_9ACTN
MRQQLQKLEPEDQALQAPVRRVAQPLVVGAADDRAEVEADRVADEVIARIGGESAGAPEAHQHGAGCDHVQRVADGTGAEVGMAGGALSDGLTERVEQARGGGAPLEAGVRSQMEAGFGRSLAHVRIHDGAESADLNRKVSARAFTAGNDVFFGAGEYQPGTPGGQRVLAHELAHVVQNGGAPTVKRWPGGKKKEAPADKGGGGVAVAEPVDAEVEPVGPKAEEAAPPDVAGNEGIAPVAQAAIDAAVAANPKKYGPLEQYVSALVPQAQQKELCNLGKVRQQSKGDTDKRAVKDLLRAYLLYEYVSVLFSKLGKPQATTTNEIRKPTEAERKKFDSRYFPKTLEVRDKWKGLLDKGADNPETRAWLKSQGFDGAVTAQTPTQKAAAGGGPRLDVRATFIGGNVLGAPRRMHLFLVYTGADGELTYFRGGPDENDMTVCDYGDFHPGIVDWDPSAPSVTVLKGDKAQAKLDRLVQVARQIDGMQVPYKAAKRNLNAGGLGGLEAFVNGENCNAVAWTLLNESGIPTKKPSGVHPGWGHKLGSYLKQGKDKGNEVITGPEADGPGVPITVSGKASDAVPGYADRAFTDKTGTIPGGVEVSKLAVDGNATKVRYQNVTYWIDSKKVFRPGRPFFVAGEKDRFYGPLRPTDQYVDAWQRIEVLDPTWKVGEARPVEIRAVVYGHTVEGFLDGGQITDTDPKIAAEKMAKAAAKEKAKAGAGKIKGVLKAGFTVPMFDEEGNQHPMKAANGAAYKPIDIGYTGRTNKVDGELLVEFDVFGKRAWMPAKTWKKLFGTDYPKG